MRLETTSATEVPAELVEAVRTFPVQRTVEHCGQTFSVSAFDFYATCPRCGQEIKVRSFAAVETIEDLFDAFFEWMKQPGAAEVIARRQAELEEN
jgi:hypothetical protein